MKKQTKSKVRRNWPFTVICSLLVVGVLVGTAVLVKDSGFTSTAIITIIIPALFLATCLFFIALSGRPKLLKDAIEQFVTALFAWR